MVLGDDFDGEVVLLDGDVRVVAHCLHQSALYLGTGVVGMVEDAELRVPALTMQVELTVTLLVEVNAPVDELTYLFRCLAHHLFYGLTVGDVVARDHGVLDVLVEVVELEVGDRCYATLCERGIGLVERGLADHADTALLGPCHLEGIAHTSHTSTYHEKVVFVNHLLTCFVLLSAAKVTKK